jgi:hypothetical protein
VTTSTGMKTQKRSTKIRQFHHNNDDNNNDNISNNVIKAYQNRYWQMRKVKQIHLQLIKLHFMVILIFLHFTECNG